MSEIERVKELMEVLFSRAESQFLNHFSRKGGEGYGGARIEPWSKEYRMGVLAYMKMYMGLLNLDYYERSLQQKIKEMVLKQREKY